MQSIRSATAAKGPLVAAALALSAGSAWAQDRGPEAGTAVRGERLYAAVRTFVGDLRGGYNYPDQPLADAILNGLGGPPEPTVTLSDGALLVSGCRRHSCVEKSAIILDARGNVRAAALIHFNCADAVAHPPEKGRRPPPVSDRCLDQPVVQIVQRAPFDGHLQQQIIAWSQGEIDVDRVDTVVIPEG